MPTKSSSKTKTKDVSTIVESMPVKFVKKGITFTQVKRNDNALVYKLKNQEGNEYYEVFLRKTQPAFSLWSKGNTPLEYKYPAKEKYPNDEQFGVWAWTYTLPKLAMAKFEEISKQ
jgi:hypothetical protein